MTAPILDVMSDAGQAIKARLDELGIRQTQFASRVGKSSSWTSAQFLPNAESTLLHLASKEPNTFQRILDILGWDLEDLEKETGVQLPSYVLKSYDPDDTEEIPFWGNVSAGNGKSHSAQLGVIRWERDAVKRYRRYGLYCLEVDGTSMLAEDIPYSIPPKAKVLVARNLEPQPGDVVVIWLSERGRDGDGLGVIKLWNPGSNHAVLRSWNRQVLPIVIGGDEPFELQGTVVDVRYSPRDLKKL
ncbi:MAG: S24 family peptidase [Thermaceae bacterium]|nr:S24 family peptidase [Thermaceae bacterium]